jgi:hypothetical protein
VAVIWKLPARPPTQSVWELPTRIVGLVLIGLIAVGLALLFGRAQAALRPPEAFLWGSTNAGNIARVLAALFLALPLGMIGANLIAWSIPAVRHAIDQAASDYPRHQLKGATRDLTVAAAIIAVPSLIAAAWGITDFFYLTPSAVVVSAGPFATPRRYGWDQVEAIVATCRETTPSYMLSMRDGARVDLTEAGRMFDNVFPSLGHALKGRAVRFDASGVRDGCEAIYADKMRHAPA